MKFKYHVKYSLKFTHIVFVNPYLNKLRRRRNILSYMRQILSFYIYVKSAEYSYTKWE